MATMPIDLETLAESASLPVAAVNPRRWQMTPANWPVAILALMMLLVPALGVPSDLMLQDTLKSALVAFGVLLAALIFFWQQRQRSEPLLWHGLVWLPLGLMLYALGSMAWSHTYLAAVEAIRWFIFSLAVWLGINTLRRREDVLLLAWGIHAGAVMASLWAALQFWFDFDLFPQAAVPASTFVNRNFFAEYAVCALPFSVYLLANLRASRWLGLVALSVAFNVVALLMTGTRSALVALLVLLPVFALILFKYRQQMAFTSWGHRLQLFIGLVLLIGVVALGSLPSGNASIIQENSGRTTALQRGFLRTASMAKKQEYTEGSFSIRAVMWRATARMALANPMTGVGVGAWEVEIPWYRSEVNAFEPDFYAHNEFLQLLAEYGLPVGGSFLAVLLAYLLWAAGKTWRLQGERLEAPLRAFTLASLLALLIVSNAGFPWRLASTGALFALGLAILAASDARLGLQQAFFVKPLRWRPLTSRAMLLLLLACTLLAAYITQQAALVERDIVQALHVAHTLTQKPPPPDLAQRKAEVLQNIREAIAINPHYRKLTPFVANWLAGSGDWDDALWIWESVAASRPQVAALWFNIVKAHIELKQYRQALPALRQLERLQPNSPRVHTLEVILLSRTGQTAKATQLLNEYLDHGDFDPELLQAAYEFGFRTQNWALAIRTQELRLQNWPQQATSAYFKLGLVYADPKVHDEAKALAAFRAGLQTAPAALKDKFRSQTPEAYRSRL